ncbi:MAG: TIGR03560 family F420-dependent LLM class oxidoreductase [Acidimicrobiales bacterium]
MRFSIWPSPMRPWAEVLDLVQHCEATGWDGAYYADHFMPNSVDGAPQDGPTLECWAVVAGLAAAVPRLRVGTLVCGNTYRHPAVLANIAAAVDHVSGGRLILGLGAGWQVNEHAAYGIDLPPVRERLDRFEEACEIVVGLLRDQRTTFTGTHYTVTDAPNDPKPVRARLPLLVGGGGEKRTMRIAARWADEWNTWATPEVIAHKRDVLHRHCDALGRDPAEIAVSTQALMFLSDDESWLAEKREADVGRAAIIGTPPEVAEIVASYREAGVDELIVPDWTMGSINRRRDTCDQFIEQVAALLRMT